jgi:cell division protein FtsZ
MIIQNAADDDANIIFGAVHDEKMKDSVKITVIATGFKGSGRPRRRFESSSAYEISPATENYSDSRGENDTPAPPLVMDSAAEPSMRTSAETVSIDTIRDAMISNFEQSDLDVPAFLRKRNEVV